MALPESISSAITAERSTDTSNIFQARTPGSNYRHPEIDEMKSSRLLSILAATGVILFNLAIVAAQPAAERQRDQDGGG